MDIPVEHAVDDQGRKLGYALCHPIKNLGEDLAKIKPSLFSVDRELTFAWKNAVEEAIGDILPSRITNRSLEWHITPSSKIVALMGMENMMCSMALEPERMHALYAFLKNDLIAFFRWLETERLLTLNNENNYVGAGSYGFTTELPGEDSVKDGKILTRHLWANLNSQETLNISPDMFQEMVFPYYKELAGEFGLTYYGCCEPVHALWDKCISRLPGLRKVSVSPWCDEKFMGQVLSKEKIIYSRKPSPNFIGLGTHLNETAFSEHIEKTLRAAENCHLEFIFRDIYTLNGDRSKPGRAVKITRDLIDKNWN
jgi:hypothetical protein